MFLLLGTVGCHLCEQANELVAKARLDIPKVFELKEIDIAEQTAWQTKYAIKIPVLLHIASGRDLCWPFSQQDLFNFISELNHD